MQLTCYSAGLSGLCVKHAMNSFSS